jgi:hypothetical protein
MADYRKEFPDFAPETMPALPEGWADTSWRNDQCPSFERIVPGTVIRLFINYADVTLREFEDGRRFDAWLDTPDDRRLYSISSDDLSAVLAWADDVAARSLEILATETK